MVERVSDFYLDVRFSLKFPCSAGHKFVSTSSRCSFVLELSCFHHWNPCSIDVTFGILDFEIVQ